MATWRQKFESLSAVEREEIGKWKGGSSNIPALRQAMDDGERVVAAIQAVDGKKLFYKQPLKT